VSCGLGIACILPWFVAVWAATRVGQSQAGPFFLFPITHLPLLALAIVGHVAIARTRRKIHLLYVFPLAWELITVGSLLVVAMLEHHWPWTNDSFEAFCFLCWLMPMCFHALLIRRLYRPLKEQETEAANQPSEGTR
jgi:hypothetical protein